MSSIREAGLRGELPRPPADLPPDLMLDFDAEAKRLRAALGIDGCESA